jgi:hypothetical protein
MTKRQILALRRVNAIACARKRRKAETKVIGLKLIDGQWKEFTNAAALFAGVSYSEACGY